MYYSLTVGASGAIYGLLLAWAMYFPHRTIYFYFLFPIPARVFVIIVGAIAFLSSFGGPGSGIAHVAHLGGLVVGYVYLKMSARASAGRTAISLAALAHGSGPQPLRRLLRRQVGRRRLEARVEEAYPLGVAGGRKESGQLGVNSTRRSQ